LLRQLATGEAVFDQVDWPHVLEEIEDLGHGRRGSRRTASLLQTVATSTTEANRQLAGIQDRMPVIIARIGRSGSARSMAILLRFSARLRKTSCAYGGSARRSRMQK
jgi:hypothetical protein